MSAKFSKYVTQDACWVQNLIVLQETQAAFTMSVFPKDQDPCDIKKVYVHVACVYIYIYIYM